MIKPLNIDLVTITICILCRSAILSPLHPHICTYHNQPLFYNCKNYAMAGPSIAPDPQFLYSSPYQVSSKTPNKIKEPTDGESHPSMQPWGWSSAARDVDLPWCGTVTGDGGGVVLWWVRLTRWECVYMSSSLAAVVFRSIPLLGENCPAYIDERTGVSSERRSEESKACATAPPQVVGRASRVVAPKIRDDRASWSVFISSRLIFLRFFYTCNGSEMAFTYACVQ